MYYYSNDLFMMLVFVGVALLAVTLMRRMMSQKPNSSTSSSSSSASSTAKPQAVSRTQMAEDIKATKTSQVCDAVSILDDLGSTTSTYRHYCELIGTSMASSGVMAPYSKREVAYYDIKCYRIDATYGGGQQETLVAHEHSFDPFFFTDASCDTPVYIDLESFGDNVILVNSTNHIEGPNSDFAKAFQQNAGTATSSTSAGYAMTAQPLAAGANLLRGAAAWLRSALQPLATPALSPALVGGGSLGMGTWDDERGSNLMRADHGKGAPGKHGPGPHGPHGGKGGPGGQPQARDINVRVGNATIHMGYGGHIPGHLGDFMGPSNQPYVMGGGYTTHRPTSPNSTEILLGMGLGALLSSMSTTQQVTQSAATVNTFRGYRLVENIVPLRSPIYCIGEIYRHGTDVYMSRSLAKDYPTSFFATKPEAEVLSAIGTL